jgi:uncharacterized membrane protein HdeD (DUF308 family)
MRDTGNQISDKERQLLSKVCRLFYLLGGVTILIGLIVILAPAGPGRGKEILVAVMFLLACPAQGAAAVLARRKRVAAEFGILAVISLAAGLLILSLPKMSAIATFTTLVGIIFIFDGALHVGLGMALRPLRIYFFALLIGVTSLIFSLLIWTAIAGTSPAHISVLVGVNFILRGILLGLFARGATRITSDDLQEVAAGLQEAPNEAAEEPEARG